MLDWCKNIVKQKSYHDWNIYFAVKNKLLVEELKRFNIIRYGRTIDANLVVFGENVTWL